MLLTPLVVRFMLRPVHCMQIALKQETKHRPMDLRAAKTFGVPAPEAETPFSSTPSASWEASLKIASHIAAEARAAVKVRGFNDVQVWLCPMQFIPQICIASLFFNLWTISSL